MTARVSLSVDGIEPSVLERAEASARRAGMSLNDWLNSTLGHSTYSREAQDVAEIHKRLDSIARQVEHISRAPMGGAKGDPGVARQLNDAISRLDARLSHISGQSAQAAPYQPAPAFRPSPPMAPAMSPMDFSIAEIIARQGQLDGLTSPQAHQPTAAQMPAPSFVDPAVNPPPVYAAPPLQPQQTDFSGLERQLSEITSQIATLQRPDGLEQSIEGFRNELAEIRRTITEALPRREIESLENEIRSLGRRIEDSRQSGVDGSALAGIERALSEIYGALRTLTPAEQFAGFDEAIRNLGGKVDSILRSSHDPSTIHQLEDAIAALKSIASNVASNEALSELAGHINALSAKVDQLAHVSGSNDIMSALEQRIAALTTALEQRDRPAAGDTGYFDNAVRAISDRLDHLQVGNDGASSLNHVEQRIHHLLERLESTGGRGGSNFSRVEEGLADILRHLEQQRAQAAAIEQAAPSSAPMDGVFVETIKRELSDIRFSQSETNRHTQDSLEAVHNTLGHVVDRLAQIEGDLRTARSASPAPREMPRENPMPDARAYEPFAPEPRTSAPQPRPELPNPAAAQAPIARAPVAPPMPPRVPAIADIAISRPTAEVQPATPEPQATRPAPMSRNPIDPTLPPDHPLEPGTKPQQGRVGTPSERIAASEGVLNEISSASSSEPVSPTNFIQAARRAAQAAAAAPAATSGTKANRVTALNDAARTAAKAATTGESKVSSRIRALLVGASVVVIVLGTVKMGLNLLNGRDHAQSPPAAESSSATPALPPPVTNGEPHSENVAPSVPSITSPTPIDRQSLNVTPPPPALPPVPAIAPVMPSAAAIAPIMPQAMADVTGSVTTPAERVSVTIPPAAAKTKSAWIPVNDKLPDGIGSATLRAAANKGDPGAAFEIGVRYAEGRGVASDYAEAIKWYERASLGGIVPATFRLGALYEKGLGAKKDIDAARRYYIQAAEKGSAKAMHNLAVLDADGGGAGPNYKSAAQWFRKAAERGVADSQFNLGILYARGIGVEQNLAESYKWFSLAAAQGDADSGRKRDDIAKRLDAQSLAAAKLAIQTFTAEAQPDDAISVGTPPGGWDAAPAPKAAAKSFKPGTTKSAAR